ncbi:MAG: response regulator transcription factor [Sulfuricellaceae bacterium]|jgi:CheY-like chemotaxis protein
MKETLNHEELGQLHMLTALYVEDEEVVREELARFLLRRLKTVYTAKNGQEGLELYRQYKPDVVIADITMPIMDGLAMARVIKDDDSEVPIIITSAHNEHDFFVESVEIGIDSYVLKPINDILLRNILKSSQTILRGRIVDSQNKLVRFVLDRTSNPTVVVHGSTPEIMNRAFLEYLGYPTEEDFLRCLAEEGNFCLVDGDGTEEVPGWNCFDYFSRHEDVLQQARLFNRRYNQEIPCEVHHDSFPELDTHILSFHPLRRMGDA